MKDVCRSCPVRNNCQPVMDQLLIAVDQLDVRSAREKSDTVLQAALIGYRAARGFQLREDDEVIQDSMGVLCSYSDELFTCTGRKIPLWRRPAAWYYEVLRDGVKDIPPAAEIYGRCASEGDIVDITAKAVPLLAELALREIELGGSKN